MAVKHLKEFLGRASISMTLDTYSHLIEGMDGGPAEAIDDPLRSAIAAALLPPGFSA